MEKKDRKYWFIIHNEGTIQFTPERIFHRRYLSQLRKISNGDLIVYYIKRIKKVRGVYQIISDIKEHPLKKDRKSKGKYLLYFDIKPIIEPLSLMDVKTIKPDLVFKKRIDETYEKKGTLLSWGQVIHNNVALELEEKTFRKICRRIVKAI